MKKINITLKSKELLYDISVTAYIVGDGMPEEAALERYRVQSAVDEDNVRKVNMFIAKAWRDIITALTAYMDGEDKPETAVDDKLPDREFYSINLLVPEAHPDDAAETLARYVHDYIVNRSLAQWFLLTKKDEAEIYAAMANGDMQSVKRTITLRRHPERVKGWLL